MSKSRLSVFFSLLFVFLSGALVGTLGYRYYSVNTVVADKGPAPRPPRDPNEVKRHIIAEMTDVIKLTPEQVEELGKILDNTRVNYGDLRSEMNARGKKIWADQITQINSILRDDQRPLYKALRDKHEKDREARNKKRQRGIQQDTGHK